MQYSRYNMKGFKVNLLSNVELEVTPLTQDAEGKLLGGFVGMQGAKAPVEKMNPITMVVAQTNLAQMMNVATLPMSMMAVLSLFH